MGEPGPMDGGPGGDPMGEPGPMDPGIADMQSHMDDAAAHAPGDPGPGTPEPMAGDMDGDGYLGCHHHHLMIQPMMAGGSLLNVLLLLKSP